MQNRRAFISSSLTAAALAATGAGSALLNAAAAANATAAAPSGRFKLRYAPHFGMFEAHAGSDLIAQLEFMADEGFTALEDNELMSRPVPLQERTGATLARPGLT